MKTRQREHIARQKERGATLRAWLEERAAAASKALNERRQQASTSAASRGVDRVPARYRVARPAPEYVAEHHDIPRRERRARGILASSGNRPHVNPDRDAKRHARLRKELR